MRGRRALLVCAAILLTSCAQPYRATSPHPALVQVSDEYWLNRQGAKVRLATLVAVDGQTMGTPTTNRDFWEIDAGGHRLTVAYQGIVLILNATLQGGHHYRIICAATAWSSVQAHVRDLGTSKIVSNVAEQPFALQTPRPITSPPLAIPVARRR
jgi:hypothetical protein